MFPGRQEKCPIFEFPLICQFLKMTRFLTSYESAKKNLFCYSIKIVFKGSFSIAQNGFCLLLGILLHLFLERKGPSLGSTRKAKWLLPRSVFLQ